MSHEKRVTHGFLSVREVAEELDVAPSRVQIWIRRNELPAVRLGRLVLIPADALRRMVDREELRRGEGDFR
jgi:excisionase family DNA binding protein